MARVNPTGMGFNTGRQFRRVADDIRRYANSVHEYNESNLVRYEWHDSHNTIRHDVVQHAGKLHPPHVPMLYPTYVPAPPPSMTGRRDRRKISW